MRLVDFSSPGGGWEGAVLFIGVTSEIVRDSKECASSELEAIEVVEVFVYVNDVFVDRTLDCDDTMEVRGDGSGV